MQNESAFQCLSYMHNFILGIKHLNVPSTSTIYVLNGNRRICNLVYLYTYYKIGTNSLKFKNVSVISFYLMVVLRSIVK